MGALGSNEGCLLGKVALYRTELRSHQSVVSILGCIALFASIHSEEQTNVTLANSHATFTFRSDLIGEREMLKGVATRAMIQRVGDHCFCRVARMENKRRVMNKRNTMPTKIDISTAAVSWAMRRMARSTDFSAICSASARMILRSRAMV